MREQRALQDARRDREFEEFAAGTAGRLLHTASLLTAEDPADNPRARRLTVLSLAHTYACWDGLRGEDPYQHARRYLAVRFAHEAWRHRGRALLPGRRRPTGALGGFTPQERLVLVLRVYEGVAEEQVAALLALPVERVRALHDRAVSALLRPPGRGRRPGGGSGDAVSGTRARGSGGRR
ncbi:sigma factor-like helix-turn-helix DNA-binding protein [Streptomyces sp. NPDC006367]|uniref:sigma factor-like helix-turn-helix DNA-binding protein n=1 Tax=unclassified Streptomyces TaxID=2593676 RepID=UPI0033AF67B6